MKLTIWNQASEASRPLILFFSGFLTEKHGGINCKVWQEPLVKYAKSKDYEVCHVEWESKSLFNNKLNSFKPEKMTLGALSTWKDATKNAEKVAMDLREFIRESKRPLTLVGHSLGGRIILRACERVPQNSVEGLIALAPAYEQHICKFENIARAVKSKPSIYFSSNDKVLAHIFSLGQNQKGIRKGISALKKGDKGAILKAFSHLLVDYGSSMAIGLYGVPSKHQATFSSFNVSPLTHIEYHQKIYEFLEGEKV